ncbi:MAG TPA: RtcB family protein [Firmicutes bacterium]|nr:RtcB family protein [Bacillota bacterium]
MSESQMLKRLGECKWELPLGFKSGMRVPGIVYADESVLEKALQDKALEQVANVATLPGIVKCSLAMPDIHWGYGFPVGGVAAFDLDEGVICPGGIGYDINCGVRLISTPLLAEEVRPRLPVLMDTLFRDIPSGVGSEGFIKLDKVESRSVLETGARWAIEKGYGFEEDLRRCEEGGCMDGACADAVSAKAIKRGSQELGTLGSGNHFLEVSVVEEVLDEETASAYGIWRGQVTVMVHTGSRGLGHQVCTDHIEIMVDAIERYGIFVPDRQLACVPVDSPEGKDYYAAMAAAANFAWANRQVLTHLVRQSLMKVFSNLTYNQLRVIYDIAHNIAKIEEHVLDSKPKKVCVHRKGATRAFWSGTGVPHPVLVPGDMGRRSWVLKGTQTAMKESFGSCCHGAGRTLSRAGARKQVRGEQVKTTLEQMGIEVRSHSLSGLAEEAPQVYKDVDQVVQICCDAGICQKVASLRPIGVLKA